MRAKINHIRKKRYEVIHGEAIMNTTEAEKPSINKTFERDIFIKGEAIHLKSVFSGQIKLDSAMMKIVLRRLAEQKKIS